MFMTAKEQEEKWLAGESIHNLSAPVVGGECCPDFSCCNPGMKWPEEKRRAFVNGDESTRHKMSLGALQELMDYHEKRRVRIIS